MKIYFTLILILLSLTTIAQDTVRNTMDALSLGGTMEIRSWKVGSGSGYKPQPDTVRIHDTVWVCPTAKRDTDRVPFNGGGLTMGTVTGGIYFDTSFTHSPRTVTTIHRKPKPRKKQYVTVYDQPDVYGTGSAIQTKVIISGHHQTIGFDGKTSFVLTEKIPAIYLYIDRNMRPVFGHIVDRDNHAHPITQENINKYYFEELKPTGTTSPRQ